MVKQTLICRSVFVLGSFYLLIAATGECLAKNLVGVAELDRLNATVNKAQSISFDATVTSTNVGGSDVYHIVGTVEKPDFVTVKVTKTESNTAGDDSPAMIVSDGKTYTVYSAGLKKFVKTTADPSSIDPSTPDAMYFVSLVLKKAGRAALDTSELFLPADFNIAKDDLTPAQRKSLTVTTDWITINQKRYECITQTVRGHASENFYSSVIDSNDGVLHQFYIRHLSKSGTFVSAETMTFNKLTFSSSKSPLSSFDCQLPADASPYPTPASPGTIAPDFLAYMDDGTPVRLSDYTGQVVVLDFWATWCGPCRVTLPSTDKLAAKYDPQGVVFLPVCTWDSKDSFQKWVLDHKSWTMTFLFDPAALNGDNGIATKLYSVAAIPTQYVIDRKGIVTYRGFADEPGGDSRIEKAIQSAMAE